MSEPTSNPSFSFSRRFGAGFNMLLGSLSLLAVVVMLNYLAGRHFWRWDCSASQRTQLSPLTLRVLEGITNEVKIIVYYDPQERLFKEATALLKEYSARNPHLQVQLVNPINNPAEAQVIRTRYRLGSVRDKDLIIFDCNNKTKSVYQAALSEYELEQVANPTEREFRRKPRTFRGELEFTSALVTVIDPKQYKACFLQGHGEQNPASTDEQNGYSKFAAVLVENGIRPELLSLAGAADIPADCSLLIIPGPVDTLTKDEVEKIERYLNQGGRLFALFGYRSYGRRVGLEGLLANWGVVAGENIVLDPMRSTPESRGQDLVLTLTENEAHAITRALYQSSLHLILPRSVASIKSGRAIEGLKVDEILHTTSEGVMVTTIRNGMPELNPARDRRGVFPLMVASEKSVRGVGRGTTRMVVAGDSFFLANQLIESAANRDFAVQAINWLVDRPQWLAGLSPRPVNEYKLNMTRAQLTAVRWILLGGLPGGVLFLGLLVWLRRRN
ncbi:MAG: GldG family protein [Verrucomicrobiota bacterium]